MRNRIIAITLVALLLAVFLLKSCAPEQPDTTPQPKPAQPAEVIAVPAFSYDSAYNYIAKQVAFGPRVPASAEHKKCGDWLVATLNSAGADTVIEQKGTVKAYNGQPYPLRNIIASWRPEKKDRRVLDKFLDQMRDREEIREEEEFLIDRGDAMGRGPRELHRTVGGLRKGEGVAAVTERDQAAGRDVIDQ